MTDHLDLHACVEDILFHAKSADKAYHNNPREALAHMEKVKSIAQYAYTDIWHTYHTSGVGPV